MSKSFFPPFYFLYCYSAQGADIPSSHTYTHTAADTAECFRLFWQDAGLGEPFSVRWSVLFLEELTVGNCWFLRHFHIYSI